MIKYLQKFFPKVEAYHGVGILSNLNFKTKIFLAFGVLLLGLILQGFWAFSRYFQIAAEGRYLNQMKQELNTLKTIKEGSPDLLTRCTVAVKTGQPVELGNSLARIETGIARIVKSDNMNTDSLHNRFQALREQLKYYNGANLDSAQYGSVKRLYSQYRNALIQTETALNRVYSNRNRGMLLRMAGFTLLVLVILVLMVVVSGWLVIAAVRTITEPAVLITEQLNQDRLAGAANHIPAYSPDGLGVAALLLNEGFRSWDEIFEKLKNSTAKLENLCQELVGQVKLREISEIQFNEVYKSIDTYINEQNETLQKSNEHLTFIISNITELQRIPEQLGQFAEELDGVVIQAEGQMEELLNRQVTIENCTPLILDLFHNLAEMSTKVDSVMGVLNGVSEQTELLAFNTAIEAARAGNKGLGFGVVSQEITKLVERSKKATEDLHAAVNAIQARQESLREELPQAGGNIELLGELRRDAGEISNRVFTAAHSEVDNMLQLVQVLEEIIAKSETIIQEANVIAGVPATEKDELQNIDLEILDYQLNLKEAVRISEKTSESSGNLRRALALATEEQHSA